MQFILLLKGKLSSKQSWAPNARRLITHGDDHSDPVIFHTKTVTVLTVTLEAGKDKMV